MGWMNERSDRQTQLGKKIRKKEIKEGIMTVRKKEEFESKGEGGTKILFIQPK
jgi:hypothetical protein